MKNIFFFSLVIFSISFISCNKDEIDNKTSFTKSDLVLMKSSNEFGIDLFRDLADNNPVSQNIFISPLSVYMALAMAYNGAASETAIEMQNTLGFKSMSNEEINVSCHELVNKLLNVDPDVAMEIANSIWYRNTFEVKQGFININHDYFDAEVRAADFSNPATGALINDWVKAKTHDKIEKVIDGISPLSMMYLINAIYFKGAWKNKFDIQKSFNGTFYRSENDFSPAVFMSQAGKYKYYENNVLQALELPYGNSGFSMEVLLPVEGKSVGNIISDFTPSNWELWNNNMDSTKVSVKLPRFKFAYDSVINESLKTLGMPKAFDDELADFSNISEENQLYISKVLHKSFVEVNEDGTEAAAVTVVEMFTNSIPVDEIKYFTANKPFVFLIKENTTQTILFAGIMNKPVSE